MGAASLLSLEYGHWGGLVNKSGKGRFLSKKIRFSKSVLS